MQDEPSWLLYKLKQTFEILLRLCHRSAAKVFPKQKQRWYLFCLFGRFLTQSCMRHTVYMAQWMLVQHLGIISFSVELCRNAGNEKRSIGDRGYGPFSHSSAWHTRVMAWIWILSTIPKNLKTRIQTEWVSAQNPSAGKVKTAVLWISLHSQPR